MLPPPTTMPTSTPRRMDFGNLLGDERAERRVDAVRAVAEQRLAGQLEEDPAVPRARPARRPGRRPRRGLAHSSSPSAYRVNRRTRMFSPIVAIRSVISSRTVRSSSRNGWS